MLIIHKEYPDLRLHVGEAPPRELELGLDQGKYDCQIMSEYEGTSLDAVRHMVAINMGLSFFSRLYAASEI
jgi:DNA-binding transcriptional LysR family regulator